MAYHRLNHAARAAECRCFFIPSACARLRSTTRGGPEEALVTESPPVGAMSGMNASVGLAVLLFLQRPLLQTFRDDRPRRHSKMQRHVVTAETSEKRERRPAACSRNRSDVRPGHVFERPYERVCALLTCLFGSARHWLETGLRICRNWRRQRIRRRNLLKRHEKGDGGGGQGREMVEEAWRSGRTRNQPV